MKRATWLGATVVAVTFSGLLATPALALWGFSNEGPTGGWTVIDNGPAGLPGANQYAYHCWSGLSLAYTSNTNQQRVLAQTKVRGWTDGADCDIVAGRSAAHAEGGRAWSKTQWVNGSTICAQHETFNPVTTAEAESGVDLLRSSCYVPGSSKTVHDAALYSGDFCSAGCGFGWEFDPTVINFFVP